jgi:predicted AAA+ superfamily ATPase
MRARLGPAQATVATAHTLARVVYHLLTHREELRGKSAMEYGRERRERELKHLSRRANQLGDTLLPAAASQHRLHNPPVGGQSVKGFSGCAWLGGGENAQVFGRILTMLGLITVKAC